MNGFPGSFDAFRFNPKMQILVVESILFSRILEFAIQWEASVTSFFCEDWNQRFVNCQSQSEIYFD